MIFNLKNRSVFNILFFSLTITLWQKAFSANYVVVGLVPEIYLNNAKSTSAQMAAIEIEQNVIKKITALNSRQMQNVSAVFPDKKIIYLKHSNKPEYDVVYPGLINLHNHPKQNLLPLWNQAQGQFANRFEWRDWINYKYSVGGNMNPWVGYSEVAECATYRWAQLQSMIQGVVYLQGAMSCSEGFSILRAEDSSSYVTQKAITQAPTDLVAPQDMQILWQYFKEPVLEKGLSYEEVLAKMVRQYCPSFDVSAANINSDSVVAQFKDLEKLKTLCNVDGIPDKFIRYLNWVHPGIAQRKNYLNQVNGKEPTGLITHLAEGRRDDAYNAKEFLILKILGFVRPKVNLIHGVGLTLEQYKEMKKNNMGLIWSPFSNLLLYGQTLKLSDVISSGVNVAIGSDWTPTGSKSVLEEVKIARRYIIKDPEQEGLVSLLTQGSGDLSQIDAWLYKAITENPAQMISHDHVIYEKQNNLIEAKVGSLAVGAMASLLVVSLQNQNIYTNLIENTNEKDIQLVIANGNPVYGDEKLMQQFNLNSDQLEVISDEFSNTHIFSEKAALPLTDLSVAGLFKQLLSVISYFSDTNLKKDLSCQFDSKKVFMNYSTIDKDPILSDFYKQSGLNLDRAQDIGRLLAELSLNQSKNKMATPDANPDFALSRLTPLYTCNDETRSQRLEKFITFGREEDELTRIRKYRDEVIQKQKLGKLPQSLADKYQ